MCFSWQKSRMINMRRALTHSCGRGRVTIRRDSAHPSNTKRCVCLAVCCSVVLCGAVLCCVLRFVAVRHNSAPCVTVLGFCTVRHNSGILGCTLATPRGVCVLRCVAVCCCVLLCVAVCCCVLLCVAVCCSVLQCVAVCCGVLRCVAVCCSVLPCVAVCCCVLQCVAVCCSILQCVAVRHTELLYTQRGACVYICKANP